MSRYAQGRVWPPWCHHFVGYVVKAFDYVTPLSASHDSYLRFKQAHFPHEVSRLCRSKVFKALWTSVVPAGRLLGPKSYLRFLSGTRAARASGAGRASRSVPAGRHIHRLHRPVAGA